MWKEKLWQLFLVVILLTMTVLLLTSCKNVMSCAGILTYDFCSKYCTHEAVATCEASFQRSIDSAVYSDY